MTRPVRSSFVRGRDRRGGGRSTSLLGGIAVLALASCHPDPDRPPPRRSATALLAPPSALDERGVVTPVRNLGAWQVLFLRQAPNLPRRGLDGVVASAADNPTASELWVRFRFDGGSVRDFLVGISENLFARLRPGESIRSSQFASGSELLEVAAEERAVPESRLQWWMR